MFNQEQIKGMLERFATIVATFLLAKAVQKGWISSEDSGVILPGLILLLVAAPSVFYGWWVNRGKALAQAVVAVVPKTVVITTPDIAKETPEANIVSNTGTSVITEGVVTASKS